MDAKERLDIELELAEHTLRAVMKPAVQGWAGPGWVTNRRANIYAVKAEIARLKAELAKYGA